MDKIYNDKEFYNIVSDILENEKFRSIDTCVHHGLSRMEHSLKVSYYSYRLAKKAGLNYRSVARAGLLHDFFHNDDLTKREQAVSMFVHPYRALANACKYFELSEMEKDIIITHMFPALPHKVPKYMESWLVSAVDKFVATKEFYYSYGKPYVYRFSNLYLISLFLK